MSDEPVFSTKVANSDDGPIIYVQGEIDMETAGRLRDAIEPHMAPRQTIILDFAVSSSSNRRASEYWSKRAAHSPPTADSSSCATSPHAQRLLTLTAIEFILAEDAKDHPPT